MADKKLNEVTTVTDMAYVPVIMADGSIGQIAKADLASVVAGVLGTNKLFPFMCLGGASTDLNTVKDSGFYRLASNSYTNGPSTSMYGVLIVFNDTTSYISQMVLSLFGTPRVYVRGGAFTDNSWGDWKEISIK